MCLRACGIENENNNDDVDENPEMFTVWFLAYVFKNAEVKLLMLLFLRSLSPCFHFLVVPHHFSFSFFVSIHICLSDGEVVVFAAATLFFAYQFITYSFVIVESLFPEIKMGKATE